jgi:hypothetical protein
MKIHSIRLLAMCLSSIAAYGLVDPCLAQEGAKKDVVVRNENPNGLPVPSGDGWKPLFNGQNLDGWQQKNGWAVYRIDGNSIHGTTSKGSPNSFLCTAQDYADFELKFEVKVHNDLNSGVQIRSKSIAEKDNGRVHGFHQPSRLIRTLRTTNGTSTTFAPKANGFRLGSTASWSRI